MTSYVSESKKRALLALAVIGIAGAASGQSSEELLVRMRRAWQDQSSVYLVRNSTYRITKGEKGYVAYRETVDEELMLKDPTGAAQQETVHYSTLFPLKRLEAWTMVPQGKGYRRMPVRDIEHRDSRESHIFHDDSRVASFLMPGLVSGAIAHIEHEVSYADARFVGGHFFTSNRPTVLSTLTVVSDPGIEVDLLTFHMADSLMERSDAMEKGKRVQRITMRDIPAMLYEDDGPSPRYYAPHAQIMVRFPGAKGSGLDQLYAWYSEHIKDTFREPSASLRALSDSIVGDAATEIEKAARIYRWVQDRIHYVAIEDGMNGLVPALADEVCRSRYGDCKGMSNLMHALMKAQGLDARLAWVGTRDLPYAYSELPTASVDNHMIVALRSGDTTLFLDGTAQNNAFGVPSGFTQGKETLVSDGPDRYSVMRIPVMPAAFSTVVDSVWVRLEGDALIGTGVARFSGYERYDLSYYLKSVPPARKDELLRAMLMKGSNKFLLDDCTITGLDDAAAPLTLQYSFRIPDHARVAGNKRYVPLMLSDPWKDKRARNGRRLAIEVEHRAQHDYVVQLTLPPGASCSGVPVTGHNGNDHFGYSMEIAGNSTAITSRSLFTLEDLMLDERLPEWRSTNVELMKDLGRTLVIETP